MARTPFRSGKAANGGFITDQCVEPRGDPNQESSWLLVPEIRPMEPAPVGSIRMGFFGLAE
jgi:hypothetical protein